MKKILFFLPVIMVVFLLAGCVNKLNPVQLDNKLNSQIDKNSNYLGSEDKGNYVWGGAMNLAWNDLNDNILHAKLKLATDDRVALAMVDSFNNPVFTKNDLDEASYYIKSGYGQATVDQINKESKAKFPSKSFGDLQINLGPKDIISYAYFLKEVEYQFPFDRDTAFFEGQTVKGFTVRNKEQENNIKIIKYKNDDKFIISLQLKDNNDQLILAKGYNMSNPQDIINEINNNNHEPLQSFGATDYDDHFSAPVLHLDYHRNYGELIGKYLANSGFENYYIGQMFENIKFDMDEHGARAENEAVIGLSALGLADDIKIRNFTLDKPYWVIMQRKDSKKPYFILGINNTELMTVIPNPYK